MKPALSQQVRAPEKRARRATWSKPVDQQLQAANLALLQEEQNSPTTMQRSQTNQNVSD